MNVLTRVKVSRNADYHTQMAEHYAGLAAVRVKESTEGAEARDATPSEEEYLASLHADIAQQLRDVLGEGQPPAILGTTPPVIRDTTVVTTQTAMTRGRASRQVH